MATRGGQPGNTNASKKHLIVTDTLRIVVTQGRDKLRKGLEQEVARINQAARKSGAPTMQLWTEVAGDGPHGVDRQIAQMRKMVDAKPDVIIVQPTDNAALTQPLLAANKAGIPVIAYDQYIAGGMLAVYISSDNY